MITAETIMAILSFVAVTGIVLAVALLIRDLRRPDQDVQRRLDLGLRGLQSDPAWKRTYPKSGRIDQAFYSLIEGSGRKIDQQTAMAIVIGFAVIGCAAPLLLLENLLAAAAGLLLGAMLPICWWGYWRARRLQAMRDNLPETLDLLADSIRAGQTLEQASGLVAQSVPAPLNEEFGYCVSQLKLGHPPVAVMERMAWRIPLPEFKIFTTAVVVHQQTGGNLSLLAHRLAGSARDRQHFHGHIKAVTAAGRFSVVGMTLGTLIALMVLAGIRPEYLQDFLNHRLGPPLLLMAGVLLVVGIVWVWQTLKVRF